MASTNPSLSSPPRKLMADTKASSSQESVHFFHSSRSHPPSTPILTKLMVGGTTGAGCLPAK
eukprot:11538589-Prorocentrum_lima.AAC.1